MWVWVCGVRLEAGHTLPGSLSTRWDLCGRAGSRTSCRGSSGEDRLNLAVSGIEKHHSVRVHCGILFFFYAAKQIQKHEESLHNEPVIHQG